MKKIILGFRNWLHEVNLSTLGKEIVNIGPVAGLGADPQSKKNLVAAAVALVREYDKSGNHSWIKQHLGYELNKPFGYLLNIDTIAPLGNGAYGMFVSNETERVLPPEVVKPYEFQADKAKKEEGQRLSNFLKNQAIKDIRKQFPQLDTSKIQDSATIHLNVPKTKAFVRQEISQGRIRQEDYAKEMVIRLASTIAHESTHQLERKYHAKSNEFGPEKVEAELTAWARNNPQIVDRIVKQ